MIQPSCKCPPIVDKSSLDKEKSLLHFEVYYKDNAIDPENLYTMSVSDLK